MFLTHLDEDGNDSPAILIENATAANRAVNIPEFVNIPPGGLLKIDAPVTEYYRVVDTATDLLKKNQYAAAAVEWSKALELEPDEAPAHNNLGLALVETGKVEEGIAHYRKALELSPGYPEAHNNLGQRAGAGPPLAGGRGAVREGAGIQSEARQRACQSGGGAGADGAARRGDAASGEGGRVAARRCGGAHQSGTRAGHEGSTGRGHAAFGEGGGGQSRRPSKVSSTWGGFWRRRENSSRPSRISSRPRNCRADGKPSS